MSSTQSKAELVATADAMLMGEMDLIEGCRRICSLRHAVGDPDNGLFLPIIAIESETDHFPIVGARKLCAPEYLKRMDEEIDGFLQKARNDILNACREIVRAFSPDGVAAQRRGAQEKRGENEVTR